MLSDFYLFFVFVFGNEVDKHLYFFHTKDTNFHSLCYNFDCSTVRTYKNEWLTLVCYSNKILLETIERKREREKNRIESEIRMLESQREMKE